MVRDQQVARLSRAEQALLRIASQAALQRAIVMRKASVVERSAVPSRVAVSRRASVQLPSGNTLHATLGIRPNRLSWPAAGGT